MLEVYKELTVRGDPVRFEAFIQELATAAAPAWSRDQDREQELTSSLSTRVYVFKSSADTDRFAASLFFTARGAELTVTNIVPHTLRSLTRDQYNALLDGFARLYIRPIAARFGFEVELTPDRRPITHWLSEEAAGRLIRFSHAANKGTGSGHPLDFDRWVAFLIQAHREAARLDATTLSRWLVEEDAWPGETASALAVEYEFGRSLLKAYDAAR